MGTQAVGTRGEPRPKKTLSICTPVKLPCRTTCSLGSAHLVPVHTGEQTFSDSFQQLELSDLQSVSNHGVIPLQPPLPQQLLALLVARGAMAVTTMAIVSMEETKTQATTAAMVALP